MNVNLHTKLVIFDLDGTLVDSLTDLAVATNYALEKNGFTPHPIERYKTFVGNGMLLLITRALPESCRNKETISTVKNDFWNYYFEHLNDHTLPYPGITDLLIELEKRHIKIAVATNKPQKAAEAIIAHCFKGFSFISVQGQIPERPTKPDPCIVHDILKVIDVSLDEILYVGDSGVDMQTTQNAHIMGIGCLWGFRGAKELLSNGAVHLIDKPIELLNFCK